MRPKEPIALKARDGMDLHGYVTRPAGDGPHPLVVMPHGGPHGIRDCGSSIRRCSCWPTAATPCCR